MKRWLALTASILIQSCLGVVYAWSTFVPALTKEHNLHSGHAGIIFGVCIASFTISIIFGGILQQKAGSRLVSAAGGILLLTGYLAGSFSGGSFPVLLASFGVIAGAGIGLSYVCPLATNIKWFPDHKGLITGLTVAGFGLGALFFAKAGRHFLDQGLPVLEVLRNIGLIVGITVILASYFLFLPESPVKIIKSKPLRNILMNKDVQILMGLMFCGTFGGLLIIGNLKPIGLSLGLSTAQATLSIMIFAIGNAAGRILWGILYDRTGVRTITWCITLLGISAGLMSLFENRYIFYLTTILIAFSFGGFFVLFAAQVANIFGADLLSKIYPFIFLGYGIAGLTGPPIGGAILHYSNSHIPATISVVTVSIIGIIIAHFPEENLIWSYGSGYGGNALLGKKCLALRIASAMAGREGWMAEHMLILRFTNPEGKQFHIAAAFPSACGKTNLAMLQSTMPGWKVETIGDDIAWMKIGKDGRLYAINPESGFFGVAPGTAEYSNPMALASIKENAIFTNVVVTDDKDVWWEDMGVECSGGTDWKNNPWKPGMKDADGNVIKGAHPNSRFTAPASQCPVICKDWENPAGVPIDIFVFGGKRTATMPLVHEAFDFDQGIYMGATASSEPTAAALDVAASLRFDPFAMTPFIGYHAGDYMQHWFDMGDKLGDKAPRCFYVNWFRKDDDGNWLWPGFGENSRVLKWMCERVEGKVQARETPIGLMPIDGDLTIDDLDITAENWEELMNVDTELFKSTLADAEKYLSRFGDKLPPRITEQLEALKSRLG